MFWAPRRQVPTPSLPTPLLAGTGKTAAYALPILDILSRDPYGVFALVLLPSRELAMQVADQWHALVSSFGTPSFLDRFGSSCAAKSILVIGGVDMTTQGQAMSRRPHIVIATLGRLAAHFVQTDATAPYFQYLKVRNWDTRMHG
eukprot:Polyplicarium_translucidae@DN2543_c0_g1_i3.p1